MTEDEWASCTDPTIILEYLRRRASDRKITLYLCGGARALAPLLFDPRSMRAVEVAERYVDGGASPEELHKAAWDAECPTFGYDFEPTAWQRWVDPESLPKSARRLVEMGVLSERNFREELSQVDQATRDLLLTAAYIAEYTASEQPLEQTPIMVLLPRVDWPGPWLAHCVFGNPFRPVALAPTWLTANVTGLARLIYDERAFERLPVLADALIDGGCTDEEILGHCRSPGPHVRGCWVVDLLLGKG